MGVYIIPFVGVLVFPCGISILMVLQMIDMFRSILKRGVITSSCNTFHVGLRCESCLHIDSF